MPRSMSRAMCLPRQNRRIARSSSRPSMSFCRTILIRTWSEHLSKIFRTKRSLDRVRHPNIISRLGHRTARDLSGTTFHYLVLEYLPGGDLQRLCREKARRPGRALGYIEQVCAGLRHAHSKGVIHRDIKPHNLLLTKISKRSRSPILVWLDSAPPYAYHTSGHEYLCTAGTQPAAAGQPVISNAAN